MPYVSVFKEYPQYVSFIKEILKINSFVFTITLPVRDSGVNLSSDYCRNVAAAYVLILF